MRFPHSQIASVFDVGSEVDVYQSSQSGVKTGVNGRTLRAAAREIGHLLP